MEGQPKPEYTLSLFGGGKRPQSWIDWWKATGAGGSSGGGASGGGTGGTSVVTIWNAYLGGSRALSTDPNASPQPVPEYVEVEIDSSRFAAPLTAKVTLKCRGVTAMTPRIYNVSDSVVAGTGSQTS